MPADSIHRISRGRLLTPEEAARYRALREEIAVEAPSIIERGRKIKAEVDARRVAGGDELERVGSSVALQDTMLTLACVRVSQGLSLADLSERTGIDRSVLSKLERREVANPTVDTLNRIASGLGRKLVVSAVLGEGMQTPVDDGPLSRSENVVVVPARRAWGLYEQFSVYICQKDRPFRRGLRRIAFYSDKEIKRFVPEILDVKRRVDFVPGRNSGDLDVLITSILNGAQRKISPVNDIYFLSAQDSPGTIDLGKSIRNEKKDRNGNPVAFVMKQRYVSMAALRAAKSTSDLEN